jgi:hypothetical protein
MRIAPAEQIENEDNWSGANYALVLEVGDRDDARLEAAFLAMGQLARISEFRAGIAFSDDPAGITSQVEPVAPTLSSLVQFGHLRGTVELPDGNRVVCGLLVVREEVTATNRGKDWLEFFLPLNALAKIEPRVGFFPHILPGDADDSLQWRRPIDDWLAEIGSQLFRTTRFRLGVIGAEFGFDVDADRLRDGIPDQRAMAYLWPDVGQIIYYPATF